MPEHDERTNTGAQGIAAPAFRLPPETRAGRVRLQVADLERSLAFYEEVLGFRALERSGSRASLGAVGAAAPLIELHERRGATPVPRHGRLGLYHFAILLPDRGALGAFLRHLTERGVRPGASDHLVSEALYLHDPDGLGIEVYADRPRAAWRHRHGQLQMATDPLDLAGVMEAAGSTAWHGMPAGTTMGHVHLHVGDLARAEAFYHEALGLDKVVWSYPGALFLSAGGYHHHLGVNTWAGAVPAAGQNDARLLDWELVVPTARDVEDVMASMRGAGQPAERSAEGARLRDPWGSALCVRAAEATTPPGEEPR
jgi:catechol 2,3-dioxygenase